MKYHLFSRSAGLHVRTSITDRWTYYTSVETFADVEKLIKESKQIELRVIKGIELPIIEDVEEVTYTQRVIKNRRLTDV